MQEDRAQILDGIFAETIRAHGLMRNEDPAPILKGVDLIRGAFGRGGKLLVFGNGGSAADAQHFAAELVGRFVREKRPLPAIALSTDTSVLTGVSNDYGYEQVFARQVEALGQACDVAFAISTSGEARNVLAAVVAARRIGLATVGLTGGNGGALGAAVDTHIAVPAASTARIQEVHRTILHAMCELLERESCERYS